MTKLISVYIATAGSTLLLIMKWPVQAPWVLAAAAWICATRIMWLNREMLKHHREMLNTVASIAETHVHAARWYDLNAAHNPRGADTGAEQIVISIATAIRDLGNRGETGPSYGERITTRMRRVMMAHPPDRY